MYTLDSNIIIAYLNGDDRIARQMHVWRKQGARFFVSVITEIEVLALPRLTPAEHDEIARFLQTFTVIPLDTQLGRLTAALRRRTKLGLGDCAVLATAQLTDTTLVTNDKTLLRRAGRLIACRSIPAL